MWGAGADVGGCDGAGDWERDDDVEAVFGGGPLAQADLVGSTVGILADWDAVEDLLILQDRSWSASGHLSQHRHSRIMRGMRRGIDMEFVDCSFFSNNFSWVGPSKVDLPAGEKAS